MKSMMENMTKNAMEDVMEKAAKKKVLIVTGGSIDYDLLERYIKKEYDYIIAADKGLLPFLFLDRQPDCIVGDFDSADADVVAYYKEYCAQKNIKMIVHPCMKDETDTHLALLLAIEEHADFITILGGTGTRFDHSFANISLLTLLLDKEIYGEIVDRHNRISMLKGGRRKVIRRGEQYGDFVSLIPYTEAARGITLKGFLYPLSGETLELGISRGISNEISGEAGEIFFEEGILIVVEARD